MINKSNSYLLASIISFLCIMLLLQTDFERWNQPGPFNPGHEDLACNECHLKTKSSVRQQLQANVQYLLEQRKTEADFYYHKIGNKHCIACHNMDKDLHSSYRFNEPRFNEVREKIHPEQCVSCHKEHVGQRISQFKISDCKLCHKELKIKNDPITVPHEELIERKDWQTCLGCHDYHGNHDMVLEKTVGRAIRQEQLLDYFSKAESPYTGALITKARSTRYEK